MSLPEERAARNEALFREVNEQARAITELQQSSPAEELMIVCECSDDSCTELVSLSPAAYESVRADPRQFIVVAGHESEFERVVERFDRYLVVEKEGRAGQLAEQTDPRT